MEARVDSLRSAFTGLLEDVERAACTISDEAPVVRECEFLVDSSGLSTALTQSIRARGIALQQGKPTLPPSEV